MNIREKLLNIQKRLQAPKNQYNNFGEFYYRNCEDILEALKPLLHEYRCTLLLTDTVDSVGDRYYVKAQAVLLDMETEDQLATSAFARETETKKGMDASQITGSASSYARKYALNGLFAIDDTKDADHPKAPEKTSQRKTGDITDIFDGELPTEPAKPKTSSKKYICADTGEEVPQTVAAYSLKKYGKVLSFKSQQKYKKQ